MPSDRVLLDREREVSRVLTELSRLALADLPYVDVVQAALTLLEQLVLCPLVCLSIRERSRVGHYARTHHDVEPEWAEDIARAIAATQERMILDPTPGLMAASIGTAVANGWVRSFPVWSRSGRNCSLALAAGQPVDVSAEEEDLMVRLTEQVCLVLDHALLREEIEELQVTDSLTGAANLRRLLDVLDREIHRHRHDGARLALLVIDVQGLDVINRSYGRRYGNHVLTKLAALLQQTMRPIDLVARYGVDEFAVVLPQTDEEQGVRLAGELRDRVQHVEFAGGEITLSVGVAHVKPSENLTPEELLRRAEQALHQDKRQQRAWTAALQPHRVR